jgi:DNA-binding NarL/FixJ family response regulator
MRIDPKTYLEREQARLKRVAVQLRLVHRFRRRLEAQFPKRRKPKIVVSLIYRDSGLFGETMQVEVFGEYTKRQHPFAVDEAIRTAGKGTMFWERFSVKGTGTNQKDRIRDNTFWATSE